MRRKNPGTRNTKEKALAGKACLCWRPVSAGGTTPAKLIGVMLMSRHEARNRFSGFG